MTSLSSGVDRHPGASPAAGGDRQAPAAPDPPSGDRTGGDAAGAPGPRAGAGAAPTPSPATGGLSVSQLAERSGVGVPSIHHYRRLGLLPPPVQVTPTRFRYDERHVEALQAIRLLRERRGMPLATIREVLPDVLAAADQQAFRPEMWDAVLAVSETAEDEHDETRARLVAAARAAFVARGYPGVNVEQLCQRTGIAKGSFYRYFASKEAVYVAAAVSVADVVADAVRRWRRPLGPADAVEAVAGALRPVLPLVLEVVVRAAHGEESLAAVVPGIVAGVADVVAPRLADGDDREAARRVAEEAVDTLFRQAAGLRPPPPAS